MIMLELQLIFHFYLVSLLFFGIALITSLLLKSSSLKKRTLTLLGLLHLLCLALSQGVIGWTLFIISVLAFGLYEFYQLYALPFKRIIFYSISNAILLIAGLLADVNLIELSIPAVILMILTTLKYDESKIKNPLFPIAFSSCFLIPCVILLIDLFKINPGAIISIFFLLQFNDSFGYIFGKKWGKTYLFPTTSPNKSLEGYFLGGVGIVLGLIFLHTYIPVIEFSIFNDAILLGIFFLFGNMGDLFFSLIKRKLGIKDFSQLLPGHGGILDRFDNLLFIAPFLHFFVAHHWILGYPL
ncbi:MAG: phosphatidate cytidylyltransferase [Cyanobacteria bacterium P01_F01_bin.150]